MISGMRNAPPISISSPRDTTASRPVANVLSTSSTAAALLLTMVASSAPVSSRNSARRWSSRSPRPPSARSYSSATAPRIAPRRRLDRRLGQNGAAEIGVEHRAGEVEHRPQRRNLGLFQPRRAADAATRSASGKFSGGAARSAASVARIAAVGAARGRIAPPRCWPAAPRSTASTAGRARRSAFRFGDAFSRRGGYSRRRMKTIRLTDLAHGGGCGCKLAPSVLATSSPRCRRRRLTPICWSAPRRPTTPRYGGSTTARR